MTLVTPDDLMAAVPGLSFDETSEPSDADVAALIAHVEALWQARFASRGVPWPTDASTSLGQVARGYIEHEALRDALTALYALSAPDQAPAGLARLADQCQADLRDFGNVLAGLQAETPKTLGRGLPRLSPAGVRPPLGLSFDQYTVQREGYERFRRGGP